MRDPARTRPRFPRGYGIHEGEEGLLPWSWATERLRESRNYWIGSTRPDDRPHAMPVWGAWIDDAVVFGTSRESAKARNLVARPDVVVHLESGDEAVILEGAVEETSDPELLRAYADECERKYDWPLDEDDLRKGLHFALRPRVAYAWLEKDYPRTATLFLFET
jgi:nitroimidazol reductase NimA-like FMN-containing flavoprotein (pyridoxamine 5'-phosphate oxidase superfamily)